MDTRYDMLERHCPRLGGPVSFRYCRQSGDNSLPCWKVFDCWWERFDVVSCLKRELSEEQFTELASYQPKPKAISLIEMIERAKASREDH